VKFVSCVHLTCTVAPSKPAVINDWHKNCSGKDLVLFVSVSMFVSG